MKASAAFVLLGALSIATPLLAQSASDHVALPDGYRDGVHFSTYERSGITEELFTSPDAIAAAKAGEPFPEGTVITMEDFRGGELYRVLVMEKRAEWEGVSQSGSWRYGVYTPDGKPNLSENLTRCETCHASASDKDYVYCRDDMLDD